MARSLNSRCDFENRFFTCDLPEDAVLLILKVKTQTRNHTLVEKQTEKFRPWKKLAKDRKQVPQKLPGVLTPQKNDNSITSDSGLYPSPTEHEYNPRFFDKPDCLSSNKENMHPIESVTPPSLRNLSLEEETNEPENEATLCETNVAWNLETMPKASSPYPRKMSTLEDLELNTDDDMIDVSNIFKRLPNDKRSPRPRQKLWLTRQLKVTAPHLKTVPHTYQWIMQQQQHLPSPTEPRSRGSSQTKERYPVDGQHLWKDSHPG